MTILMVIHAGLLLINLRRNFVVLDEVGHIPAGVFHWETGKFSLYRVNPPLCRMIAALPVLLARPHTTYVHVNPSPGVRSDWDVGRDFAELNALRYFDLVCLARLPGVAWSLLGAWVIGRWCRELYGEVAACLGVALWCFDPTVLAFAPVVTPDVPSAVAGLLATYVFWRYLKSGSWELTLLSGLLLGVAQLTKFTMVVLYGVWPLIGLIHLLARRGRTGEVRIPTSPIRRAMQALAIVLISINVINLGYAYDGTARRLGDFTFVSRTLAGSLQEDGSGRPDNRFRGSWLGRLIVPVPAEYLQGIDAQKKDFESEFPSYLAGKWRTKGWWYYYLYALAVKEPLGTLMLVLWGVALSLARHPGSARWEDEWTLLLPAGVFLAFVSSQTGFNHHMRYVLPVFPFVVTATGKLGYFLHRARWKSGAIVVSLVCWSVASSLSVLPHSMSYFNESVDGPENGHDHLLDSNIDWGQDLLHLRDWLEEHPEARPLGLAYFHFLDPRLLGIQYRLPPLGPTTGRRWLDLGPQPGYYAISVNYLRGITFSAPNGGGGWTWVANHDSFAYFRRFRPIARAGYSIYIYRITPEQADSVRREMGLLPLPALDGSSSPTTAEVKKGDD